MKKFCESLREHTMEIIIFFYKRNEFINKQTAEIMSKCKNLKIDTLKIKNILKLRTIAIILGNIEVLYITYII